ncbi:MAG: DUF4307 domain-containing protein [Flaviflexus sp.]|nr:DUF4307 domain-containing protein [Flaviflexus sp.]
MSHSAMSDEERIADRYGTTRRGPQLVIIGVAIALVIAAGIIIQVIRLGEPTVAVTNTGHTVVDDGRVRLTFTLQGEKGMTVACTATAVNGQFAEVGAKEVDITLEADRVARELILQTSERAAAGSVESCRVLDVP